MYKGDVAHRHFVKSPKLREFPVYCAAARFPPPTNCEAITIPWRLFAVASPGEVRSHHGSSGLCSRFDACRRPTRVVGRLCCQCSRAVRLSDDCRESCGRLAHVLLPARVAHGELLSGRLPNSRRYHDVIRNLGLASPRCIDPAISYHDLLHPRRFAAHPPTYSLKPL
jgi:hypothetical protein